MIPSLYLNPTSLVAIRFTPTTTKKPTNNGAEINSIRSGCLSSTSPLRENSTTSVVSSASIATLPTAGL